MLEELAIAKITDVLFEKYRKLKEIPSIQIIQFPTTDLSYSELDDATTTEEDFNKDEPNLTFENPYKKTCLVKEISIIPNDDFKTNGMLEIYIDDEIIFRNKKAGNFKNISHTVITYKRGKKIKSNESVKAFLKSSDGSSVGIALQVGFGD